VIDQCQQAVVLGAAGGAHGQMHGDARELRAGDLCAELGLDVALEHRARRPASRVAVIGLENRFQEDVDEAIGR
jgi:hypothetical protein